MHKSRFFKYLQNDEIPVPALLALPTGRQAVGRGDPGDFRWPEFYNKIKFVFGGYICG